MTFYSAGKRELASEVALHLEKGRDYEQATRCLIVAAENSSRRLAHRDSIKVMPARARTSPLHPRPCAS